jgi:hypothetical protein
MSTLLSDTTRKCRTAVRGFFASTAGGASWKKWDLVVAVMVVGVAMACSEAAKQPASPDLSPALTPSFAAGTAGNGPGQCLLLDTDSANFINNVNDLNCTSNDVDISFARVTRYSINGGAFADLDSGEVISCVPGDTIEAVTDALIQNNAQERYDLGLWINSSGGSALTGSSCQHYNLVVGAPGVSVLETGGQGGTPDQCGDVAAGVLVTVPLDTLTLVCPGGGATTVTVDACAAWANGTTGSGDRICPVTPPGGAEGFRRGTTPQTTAKCRCEPLNLPIEVKSVLRIEKQTIPNGSGQSFTFTPNYNGGATFNLSDGQTNASPPLSAGTYTAAETVPAGWTLTSRTCHVTGSPGTPKTFTPITDGVSVALSNGEDITCVFTNTQDATLRVNKICVPTTDTGLFNLRIDGATAGTGANAACGGTTGAVVVTAASHTVSETAGTGTNLTNYTSVIGGDCAADGSVTVSAGQAKVCTITNTRKPTLTVNKICVPTNDPGLFNLRIDGATAGTGANAACGGTTGAVVSTIGAHTVSETAGTGTNLADYASLIGGDCAADGTVSLAAGDNKVCTITNTKKATLTVNKICVPTTDTGLFNLRIDGATAGTGANAACGGTTGAVTVTATAHTVSETAGTGTNLTNYTSVIGGDCAADGTVTLAAGDNKTCTITNTRKPTLTVNKVCVPTTDTGLFNLRIDGATAGTGADAACGGTTGAVVSTIGAHTVSETAGTGTNLSNYTSVIGGDCAADGTVSLAAGQNKTCSITNTRKPTLRVNKVCVPTTDTGLFNLRIDGANAGTGANAACGGTTGFVEVTVGAHTVSETAGTATNLANYNTVIGGDCAADGTVSLAAGQNKTCTITNNRLPNLKVVKQLLGASATFAFTGTGTGVSANFSLTPPTDGADSVTFSNIAIGIKTITETLLNGYLLTDLSCDKGGVIYNPDSTQTVSVDLAYGDNVRCVFVNNQQVGTVTRTQGFWQTHRNLAEVVWFGGEWNGIIYAGVADKTLCGKNIDTIEKLMGGFWSNIAQTQGPPKTKRSALDQARMRLLQQLLAAMLNQAAFGSSPDGTGDDYSIAEAEVALCGTDITAINDAAADMAAFNEGGDEGDFTPGGSANAKLAKSTANLAFWDSWV